MTQDELLANLAPIRIPISFAEFTLRDGLLALCLGIFAGLLLTKLISLITTRKLSPTDKAEAEIARLSKLPPEVRLVGLSALLARFDLGEQPGLKNALYNPRVSADLAAIERAILAAVKAAK